mmetsp:Transcript_55220/g.165437  ORF Transcript_55220/g.165437 Transcript_55220/m.165437 type:complete len:431 (+) Transcript_55220:1261-2553(+)
MMMMMRSSSRSTTMPTAMPARRRRRRLGPGRRPWRAGGGRRGETGGRSGRRDRGFPPPLDATVRTPRAAAGPGGNVPPLRASASHGRRGRVRQGGRRHRRRRDRHRLRGAAPPGSAGGVPPSRTLPLGRAPRDRPGNGRPSVGREARVRRRHLHVRRVRVRNLSGGGEQERIHAPEAVPVRAVRESSPQRRDAPPADEGIEVREVPGIEIAGVAQSGSHGTHPPVHERALPGRSDEDGVPGGRGDDRRRIPPPAGGRIGIQSHAGRVGIHHLPRGAERCGPQEVVRRIAGELLPGGTEGVGQGRDEHRHRPGSRRRTLLGHRTRNFRPRGRQALPPPSARGGRHPEAPRRHAHPGRRQRMPHGRPGSRQIAAAQARRLHRSPRRVHHREGIQRSRTDRRRHQGRRHGRNGVGGGSARFGRSRHMRHRRIR